MLALVLPLVGHSSSAPAPVFVRSLGQQGRLGSLNGPQGVAWLGSESGDRLLVVDTGSARVQVFSASGQVIGAFGQRGAAPDGFWAPSDVAVAPGGATAYVVDRRHRIVQEFDLSLQCLEGRGRCFVRAWGGWGTGPGQFQEPTGIAVDERGWVYVADFGAHVVQVFDGDGAHIRTIGSVGTGPGELVHPTDVAVAADGAIWVADRDNDRVSVFDPSGTYITGHTFGDRLHYPVGIDIGPAGSVAVTDYDPAYGQARLRVFSEERKLLFEALLGGDGRGRDFPFIGVAVLPDGGAAVGVPESPDSGLATVPPDGAPVWLGERGRALGQFVYPASVAVDPLFLVVSDSGNSRVLVVEPDGGRVISVLGGELAPEFELASPRGVAVWRYGPQRDEAVIYIADPVRNAILRGTPSGQRLEPWFGDAGDLGVGFRHPVDVAVGSDGSVYVADTDNDRIVRLGRDGVALAVIGAPDAEGDASGLKRPIAVIEGPRGLIFTLQQTESTLRAFTQDGGVSGDWPGSDLRDVSPGHLWLPVDLASDGSHLYVLENESIQQGSADHVRVQVFDPLPDVPLEDCLVAVFADRQGAGDGQLWNPRGISAGKDWIAAADSGNNRVQLFSWLEEGIAPPPLLPTATPTETPVPTRQPTATPTAVPTDEPEPTEVPPSATAPPPSPTSPPSSPTEPAIDPTEVPDTATPEATDTDSPTAEPPPTETEVAPTPTIATPFADRQPGPRQRTAFLPIAFR